jgi:alkanesulfonate monooxygenase SsuD/methylene tetrahydromethanopterin reductase-like flavin-dependent oxidoreductase (luciferase family)
MRTNDPWEAKVANQPIRFSMFDWLDESGRGMADDYEDRLIMLEQAEKVGFYAYHLAEHHGTTLSQTPSPNVFLSSVAQRTKTLRLGALTYLLPHYHPIRLLEELCMMDQLSHGRLEIGVSRGSSPHEGERLGVKREDSRGMYEEALEILVQGFKTGNLDYHGKYFQLEGLKTHFRPYQKPYPPMWYPTTNPESVPILAAQGFSTAFSINLHGNVDQIAQQVRVYRETYQAHSDDSDRINGHVSEPFIGLSSLIHIAETDSKALEQARRGQAKWFDNFTRRYFERGDNKYANAPTYDDLIAGGKILVGSPGKIREQLGDYFERTGANYFLGAFAFGDLTREQILTSVDLFAQEVMPALSEPSAARV